MKRPFIIFLLLLVGSCQWLKKSDNTPEAVAVAFSKAMVNLEFEAAAKFSTPETAKLLEAMAGITSMMPEDKQKEAQEQAKFISSAKCNVEGNRAKCVVCCDKEGKDSGESVELRQENGRWLVHIDKGGGGDLASPAED